MALKHFRGEFGDKQISETRKRYLHAHKSSGFFFGKKKKKTKQIKITKPFNAHIFYYVYISFSVFLVNFATSLPCIEKQFN